MTQNMHLRSIFTW